MDELLGLVHSARGVAALRHSARGVPLVTLHVPGGANGGLASPLAIFESDFQVQGEYKGALASPLAFLSPTEVEDLRRQSQPDSARSRAEGDQAAEAAAAAEEEQDAAAPKAAEEQEGRALKRLRRSEDDAAAAKTDLGSPGLVSSECESDDDSWPPSDESEVINSGASFGARRRFGGAIDEGLKIESRELALEGAVAPLGSAGADSAMLSPATPGSAQGTGMGRLLELLPGGFVSPNLFSALQGALPWMRGPGSARQQGAPMPSTPLRTMVTC